MVKVTNEVLALLIHELKRDFRDVKDDVKANTKFRQQAGGFISAIVLIGGFVGSALTWLITTVRNK